MLVVSLLRAQHGNLSPVFRLSLRSIIVTHSFLTGLATIWLFGGIRMSLRVCGAICWDFIIIVVGVFHRIDSGVGPFESAGTLQSFIFTCGSKLFDRWEQERLCKGTVV